MHDDDMMHVLTLVAFVLPLGLDTFALSTALGAAGLDEDERLRVSLIFTSFEVIMPVLGFLIGAGIGTVLGNASDYGAAAVLAAVGFFMLWPREGDDEEERVSLLRRAHGAAVLGLGLSISLDELAIGFGGGLLRLPLVLLVCLIGLQAFLAAQIGMRLGARLSDETREWPERLAGLLLIAAAVLILVEQRAAL
jgi:manganese efflux pump family protein